VCGGSSPEQRSRRHLLVTELHAIEEQHLHRMIFCPLPVANKKKQNSVQTDSTKALTKQFSAIILKISMVVTREPLPCLMMSMQLATDPMCEVKGDAMEASPSET
jgi:hypothetical protein